MSVTVTVDNKAVECVVRDGITQTNEPLAYSHVAGLATVTENAGVFTVSIEVLFSDTTGITTGSTLTYNGASPMTFAINSGVVSANTPWLMRSLTIDGDVWAWEMNGNNVRAAISAAPSGTTAIEWRFYPN